MQVGKMAGSQWYYFRNKYLYSDTIIYISETWVH